jgi:hypothetical protein
MNDPKQETFKVARVQHQDVNNSWLCSDSILFFCLISLLSGHPASRNKQASAPIDGGDATNVLVAYNSRGVEKHASLGAGWLDDTWTDWNLAAVFAAVQRGNKARSFEAMNVASTMCRS